jgi:hypothetical protein
LGEIIAYGEIITGGARLALACQDAWAALVFLWLGLLGWLFYHGHVAAMEEVVLSKTYENTRLGFVVITRPRRAFLQFLHHNHTPSPLAGLGGVPWYALTRESYTAKQFQEYWMLRLKRNPIYGSQVLRSICWTS